MVSFMHLRTSHDNKKMKAVVVPKYCESTATVGIDPLVASLGKPCPNGTVTIMTSATRSKPNSLNRLIDERA